MKAKLTPSRIGRIRPKPTEYTIWDTATPHLGVRVIPSGAMRFIHTAKVEGRLRKTTIGDAGLMPLDEARNIARDIDAGGGREPERNPCPTFREWTEVWWSRSTAHLKPRSRKDYRRILDRNLLPVFGGKQLDGISRTAVLAWFDDYSRTSPGAANSALDLFSAILARAVGMELIPANPARKIRRNPGKKMNRFLSDEEREHLLAEIDKLPAQHLVKGQAIRMLLFTGCRCNEILTLRWKDVDNGVLMLKDSKTGPRNVWLNKEARKILEEARAMQEESLISEYVFPNPLPHGNCLGEKRFQQYWRKIRIRAGIPDVRIHDLRHSFASEAVRSGIPLPVVSKLLGHSNIQMTMRYAHVSNADVEKAVERIGANIDLMFRSVGGCS